MRALLISGLNATEDNNGLNEISLKLNGLGIETMVQHWKDPVPVSKFEIVINHSFGATAAIEYCKNNCVKYLALVEPVKTGWFPFFWLPWLFWNIPATVEKADCFVRKGPRLPPSSSIINSSDAYKNYFVEGLDHATAARNDFIVQTIIDSVKPLLNK